jgi:hypothetical protein
MLRLYPIIVGHGLNNNSLVAYASCDTLLVKVFEQRDSIFTGHAEQVFKGCDINFRSFGLLRSHKLAQALQSRLVKNQIVRQLDQHAVAEKEGY